MLGKTFVSRKYGFKFKYPLFWHKVADPDVFLFVVNTFGPETFNIIVGPCGPEDPTVLSSPLVMQQGQVADVLLTDKRNEPCANLSVKIKPVMWGNQIPVPPKNLIQWEYEIQNR